MACIELAAVEKRLGSNHVARGIDLAMQRGEGVVLLGANGCGKSTLLRCMIGLERVDAGTVTIDGIGLRAAGAVTAGPCGAGSAWCSRSSTSWAT